MPQALTYTTLFLLLILLVMLGGTKGGIIESLARIRSNGFRLTFLVIVLLTLGGLVWRSGFTMTESAERRIVSGTEPGDTISQGFNTKSRFRSLTQPLGRVYDRNGLLLAGYVVQDDHLVRYYPAEEAMAHVLGYWTGPIRDGVGVEKGLVKLNDSLKDNRPHDVELTIDLRLQQEAYRALNGNNGAVVVLDASNGELLAAASLPSFDPNAIADDDSWRMYSRDDVGRPLVSRAIKDNLSPGSSIKPLIATAALTLDRPLPERDGFRCRGIYDPGSGIPSISDHGSGHGAIDLAAATRVSCNVYFAKLAYEIVGYDPMKSFLERIGANSRLEWNSGIFLNETGVLRIAPSTVEAADEIAKSRLGIGQASVRMNPLHAAVVYASIASGGVAFAPTLESYREADTLDWRIPAVVTERIAEVMRGPVKRGGTAAGVFDGLERDGIVVYGKTGTADREPDGRAPSWFVSFGEKNDQRYAVVVVFENRRGRYAGNLNAPVAREMYSLLEKYGYFGQRGS